MDNWERVGVSQRRRTPRSVPRRGGRAGALAVLFGMGLFLWGCAGTTPRGSDGGGLVVRPAAEVVGSGGRTTGVLEIVRVELGFDAGLGEATVPRGERLTACGVARFDGNGLFRATWEVDGRALEEVVVHVVFGNTMRVCTGAGTVLPTFEPGPHQVALRVREPQPQFEVPVIRYFVTGEQRRER